MPGIAKTLILLLLCLLASHASAETKERALDVPTRTGVSQRLLLLEPQTPKGVVVLLPGGHGGLLISPSGTFVMGRSNFLVRSRDLFIDQGLVVAIMDTPSDRQTPPFLDGFRQSRLHVTDIRIVIAWLRAKYKLPVWLVGTSRGTQSVAYAATELTGADAPDGIVLSSTILRDKEGHAVTAMPLERIQIPALVVHHEDDHCKLCAFSDIPLLMEKLENAPRKQLLAFRGGENAGDPCEAFAYHGFNRIEPEVIKQIAEWILLK